MKAVFTLETSDGSIIAKAYMKTLHVFSYAIREFQLPFYAWCSNPNVLPRYDYALGSSDVKVCSPFRIYDYFVWGFGFGKDIFKQLDLAVPHQDYSELFEDRMLTSGLYAVGVAQTFKPLRNVEFNQVVFGFWTYADGYSIPYCLPSSWCSNFGTCNCPPDQTPNLFIGLFYGEASGKLRAGSLYVAKIILESPLI